MSARKIVPIGKNTRQKKISPTRLKKKIKNISFSVFIISIISLIFYFSSPLSRLSVVYFNDLEFVSRSTLLELTGLRENELFLSLNTSDIENRLEAHSLVENAQVRRKGINSLMIQIEEQQIVGCVDIEGNLMYVLNDGQTLTEDEGVSVLCHGIIIHGLSQEDLEASILRLFVGALSEINPIFVSLIEEIHYEPKFGDVNRFSLSLKDGNVVKVNSYSMVDKLEAYQLLVDIVANELGEGVTGIFNLDVGMFFQPFIETKAVELTESLEDLIEAEVVVDEESSPYEESSYE